MSCEQDSKLGKLAPSSKATLGRLYSLLESSFFLPKSGKYSSHRERILLSDSCGFFEKWANNFAFPLSPFSLG